MQLLSAASKSADPSATAPLADPRACAAALLEGLPPVMLFIRREMRRHRTCGLSVPQFRALWLLARNPTGSVSLIAEHLGSSQPSASRLIQGLVAKGLVTRKECPEDRRQVKLLLTPRGRAVLETSQRATQERLAEEIAHLPESQRKTISAGMKVLQEAFGRPCPGE
jgi:DNA-binding MarR family transcriptional regulator